MEEEKEPLVKRIFSGISFVEVAVVGVVVIVLAIVIQVVVNQRSQNPQISSSTQNPEVSPSGAPVKILGDIVCIGISAVGECEIGLKTDKGIYKIENASDSVMANFFASLGESVEISGVISSTDSAVGGSSPNSQLSQSDASPSGLAAGSEASTNTQNQFQVVGTISVATTPTPTSGILSFLSNPTSTPVPSGNFSSDYGTVKYILDNKDTLKGKIVDVSAYLIDGRVGNNFCQVINPCDHWELVLGDALTDDLDNNYWIKVHLSKSEKEKDYEIGQKVTIKGKVLVLPNSTYLVKQY